MHRRLETKITPMTSPHIFPDFADWRETITGRCGLTLSRAYCEERIHALSDPAVLTTKSFTATYGEDYLKQVIGWFRRAQEETAS
jgi:hypothetical protein